MTVDQCPDCKYLALDTPEHTPYVCQTITRLRDEIRLADERSTRLQKERDAARFAIVAPRDERADAVLNVLGCTCRRAHPSTPTIPGSAIQVGHAAGCPAIDSISRWPRDYEYLRAPAREPKGGV